MATAAQIATFKEKLPEFELHDDWSSSASYTHPVSVWGSDGSVYDSIDGGTLTNDPISSPADWAVGDLTKTIHDGHMSRAYDLALEIYRLKEIGTIYCAAHIYVVQELGVLSPKIATEAQASWNQHVTSERIGDHQVSYSGQGGSSSSNISKHRSEEFAADFSRTKYGRMFLHIYYASIAMSVRVF